MSPLSDAEFSAKIAQLFKQAARTQRDVDPHLSAVMQGLGIAFSVTVPASDTDGDTLGNRPPPKDDNDPTNPPPVPNPSVPGSRIAVSRSAVTIEPNRIEAGNNARVNAIIRDKNGLPLQDIPCVIRLKDSRYITSPPSGPHLTDYQGVTGWDVSLPASAMPGDEESTFVAVDARDAAFPVTRINSTESLLVFKPIVAPPPTSTVIPSRVNALRSRIIQNGPVSWPVGTEVMVIGHVVEWDEQQKIARPLEGVSARILPIHDTANWSIDPATATTNVNGDVVITLSRATPDASVLDLLVTDPLSRPITEISCSGHGFLQFV